MKKHNRQRLKIAFWLAILAGVLWIVFAPSPKHRHEPHQVVVTQAPETPAPEEKPPVPPTLESEAPVPSVPVPPVPPRPVSGPAKIALVIDDVGLDMSGSRRAVALPDFVTLSYMPYATRLHEQTKEAHEVGHELMLHMPMEPMGSIDPGPGALLVGLPPDELRQRFATALASFTGFDGVNNHMGSKFTADHDGMEMVIDELQQRHLFFLDSRTSAQTVGAAIAREHGLPHVSRDIFLDDDMSPKAVRNQLEQAERVARHKGYAVAIGHPHAVTLQALEEWIPDAEKRGFVFVPLNRLVGRE